MTIITAVKKNQKIAIACDTLASSTNGGLHTPAEYLAAPIKLLTSGNSIFGVAGSFAVRQIFIDLLQREEPVNLKTREDIFRWLLSHQESLKTDYFMKTDNGNDKKQPAQSQWLSSLVINPHGIFFISAYREVTEYTKFWAIGSGNRFALGALEALYDQDLSAEEIATQAARVATKFSPSCAEPIMVQSMDLSGGFAAS